MENVCDSARTSVTSRGRLNWVRNEKNWLRTPTKWRHSINICASVRGVWQYVHWGGFAFLSIRYEWMSLVWPILIRAKAVSNLRCQWPGLVHFLTDGLIFRNVLVRLGTAYPPLTWNIPSLYLGSNVRYIYAWCISPSTKRTSKSVVPPKLGLWVFLVFHKFGLDFDKHIG